MSDPRRPQNARKYHELVNPDRKYTPSSLSYPSILLLLFNLDLIVYTPNICVEAPQDLFAVVSLIFGFIALMARHRVSKDTPTPV